jgi:chromosomal replication initiator protein
VGILNKIDSFVEFRQVEPSIELVKSFISQYAPLTTKHISAKQIIDKVAEACELKPAEITGLCRQKNINEARQIVMFLIRQELKWSYPAIKTAVGRKDHTTVMNGIDSLNKKMTANPILKEKIKNIKENLYA